jgi:hypothetical protein
MAHVIEAPMVAPVRTALPVPGSIAVPMAARNAGQTTAGQTTAGQTTAGREIAGREVQMDRVDVVLVLGRPALAGHLVVKADVMVGKMGPNEANLVLTIAGRKIVVLMGAVQKVTVPTVAALKIAVLITEALTIVVPITADPMIVVPSITALKMARAGTIRDSKI